MVEPPPQGEYHYHAQANTYRPWGQPAAYPQTGATLYQYGSGSRALKRRNTLTERVDQLQALGVVEGAKAANKTQQHHPLKTGDHGQVGRRFTQHITHPLAQGVAGVHGAEEVPLQRNVIPLQAGLILHAAPFHGFIEQRALGGENMLTAGVIKPARLQLMLHALDISNTALP